MSKSFLLMDFGASRIKTAIYKNSQLECIKDFLPSKPIDTSNRKFVVSLKDIENQFREIVLNYSKHYEIDSIYICSEMHGFAVLDSNNKPISGYISWKDERCLNNDKLNSFEYLKNNYGKNFYEITGVPLVLNTSFNDKGQPIILRPETAIKP